MAGVLSAGGAEVSARIRPPTLSRDMGYCSVCPRGHNESAEIIAIEHKDAETVKRPDGRLVKRWFGFCLPCARRIGKEVAR